ncbi:hypothetical protein I5Q34_16375 [Streptomyces sp. AV19]|uniref:hypothetical protein n=1 Tax=Streptomyces sp. AV19 TaxID=2793068 RepID=UPI0018FE47A6|nr:hypothetical protein [Streptomyces sp. AV19]MBH1935825.1 hypothetical protein [Streptomyces sp. AV19]MDG4534032.1 hypothetical protein [Streptomyces sp. AV19]
MDQSRFAIPPAVAAHPGVASGGVPDEQLLPLCWLLVASSRCRSGRPLGPDRARQRLVRIVDARRPVLRQAHPQLCEGVDDQDVVVGLPELKVQLCVSAVVQAIFLWAT